jgi:hypothetical protein
MIGRARSERLIPVNHRAGSRGGSQPVECAGETGDRFGANFVALLSDFAWPGAAEAS